VAEDAASEDAPVAADGAVDTALDAGAAADLLETD
jgi:hypothetical protein